MQFSYSKLYNALDRAHICSHGHFQTMYTSCTIIVHWDVLCSKPAPSKYQMFCDKENVGKRHWNVWDNT